MEDCEFASGFGEEHVVLHNPSVKNQRFLTAPFTQGSHRHYRAGVGNGHLWEEGESL